MTVSDSITYSCKDFHVEFGVEITRNFKNYLQRENMDKQMDCNIKFDYICTHKKGCNSTIVANSPSLGYWL